MSIARRGTIDSPTATSRRDWLRRLGFTAPEQTRPWSAAPPNDRIAPVLELLNVPEFEPMARLTLAPERFETIAGGDRSSFDRMTFRQRLMVYAMDLDLTTRLFDYDMFAPIIVGPVGHQGALHPDGELATARGASAAKAVMVATRQSDQPIDQVVAASTEPVWYQIYAGDSGAEDDAARAAEAGCRALCVTVGVSADHQPVASDWDAIGRLSGAVGCSCRREGHHAGGRRPEPRSIRERADWWSPTMAACWPKVTRWRSTSCRRLPTPSAIRRRFSWTAASAAGPMY